MTIAVEFVIAGRGPAYSGPALRPDVGPMR